MARETGYLYDSAWVFKTSGAIAASAAVATIIDTGSATAQVRGDVVIEVTAMDIVGNDERYEIVLQGSPDAAFGTDTNIHDIAMISLGPKETKITDSNKDDEETSRYIMPFTNCPFGTVYRYLRLYTVCTGATASITYSARASLMKY